MPWEVSQRQIVCVRTAGLVSEASDWLDMAGLSTDLVPLLAPTNYRLVRAVVLVDAADLASAYDWEISANGQKLVTLTLPAGQTEATVEWTTGNTGATADHLRWKVVRVAGSGNSNWTKARMGTCMRLDD